MVLYGVRLLINIFDLCIYRRFLEVFIGKRKTSMEFSFVLLVACETVGSAINQLGIAKELLSRVVNEAKQYGCGTIQITASDMGVKLYTDFGFEHNGNFMQYKL